MSDAQKYAHLILIMFSMT